MTAIDDTAYPTLSKLESSYPLEQLAEILKPTGKERVWARKNARSKEHREGLLITFKLFQKLGYFLPHNDISSTILNILKDLNIFSMGRRKFNEYLTSRAGERHQHIILTHFNVRPWSDENDKGELIDWLSFEAHAKENLEDLVNSAVENLIKEQRELPPFKTLLRYCKKSVTV